MHNDLISVCMIVKNEAKVIAGCLESIKNSVKEIIIIDTGSCDDTKNICKSFDAKIYDYKWNNNFSEARNFSLSFATAPWILVLDADEIILESDLDTIKKNISTVNKNVFGFYFQIINHINQQDFGSEFYDTVVRLFRNSSKIKFSGYLHEKVDYSILENNGSIIESPVPIHHYGFSKDKNYIQKSKYYESLIKKNIEVEPENANLYLMLSYEYEKQKRYQEEKQVLEKTLDLRPNTFLAAFRLGLLLAGRLKNYKDSICFFQRAEKIYDDNLEKSTIKKYDYLYLLINTAKNFYYLKDYKNAVIYFKKSYKLARKNTDILTFGVSLYEKLNNLKMSLFYQEKLCKIKNDVALLLKLAALYLKTGQDNKAVPILKNILISDPQNKIAKNLIKIIK